ncbi:hypothetical protein BH11PAT1_BH11PAT1_7870 [soil metagenome]
MKWNLFNLSISYIDNYLETRIRSGNSPVSVIRKLLVLAAFSHTASNTANIFWVYCLTSLQQS